MRILTNPDHAADLDGLLPPDPARLAAGELVVDSRTTTVHRLDWRLQGLPCRIYVKQYRIAGKRRRALKALLRPRSPARRAWDGCLGLRARGLSAALPLACIEAPGWRLRREGLYFLCREIPGVRPWDAAAAALDTEGLAGLLETTARWLARLHQAGVDHGDLQARNLLLSGSGPDDWRLFPIDYDRVRFCRWLRPRRRARALAGVVYETEAALEPRMMAGYLQAYLEAIGPSWLSRRLLAGSLQRFVLRGRRRRGLLHPA